MNLTTFTLDSLIVHDVPRRYASEENEPIVMSEAPSTVNPALRNFFTERIARSLSKNAFEVERDPEVGSPVPDLIASISVAVAGQRVETLVAASQEMARHLFASQSGSNPPGLLVVGEGRVDAQLGVFVLKLEREDAIRVSPVQVDGQLTFDVEYLRDLMLGKNTRVFKASLFKTPSIGVLDGLASDAQRQDPTSDVANFFLKNFLGCRLKQAADVATRKFFTVTQAFINTIDDPSKKARYEIALLAAMNTPARTMTPGTVTNQLDVEDRQRYRAFLAEHEAPTARFDKDTRLVAAQIRQIVIGFEQSKLRLSGPTEDVDEFVRVNPQGPVEIHDRIGDVRGGTR